MSFQAVNPNQTGDDVHMGCEQLNKQEIPFIQNKSSIKDFSTIDDIQQLRDGKRKMNCLITFLILFLCAIIIRLHSLYSEKKNQIVEKKNSIIEKDNIVSQKDVQLEKLNHQLQMSRYISQLNSKTFSQLSEVLNQKGQEIIERQKDIKEVPASEVDPNLVYSHFGQHTEKFEHKNQFIKIYQTKMWGQVWISGGGSNPKLNKRYLQQIQKLYDNPKIKKIVEVGFGDWTLGSRLTVPQGKQYIGFDVVESLRRPDQGNIKFRIVNNVHEMNQTGDLLIVREVMQHWPNEEISWFILNIIPKFKYAVLTHEYKASQKLRPNIVFGGFAELNLDYLKVKKEVLFEELHFKTYVFPEAP